MSNTSLYTEPIDIDAYLFTWKSTDLSNAFHEIKFSDDVSNDESMVFLPIFDSPAPNHNDEQLVDDINEQNYIDCFEEVILSQDDSEQNVSEADQMVESRRTIPESTINNGAMVVIEQPKPDQRARYESDGPRFIPGSKKYPVTVQFQNIFSSQKVPDGSLGVLVTMVTTTKNPKNKTFVHVNTLMYRTDDATHLSNGSIFVPLTASDIESGKKKFPRLSIVCKKYDQYSFELIPFGELNDQTTTEKYKLPNEDQLSKAAKGKQFTSDYDLLSYKIIFQLATKQENTVRVLNIQCETDIINEQKTPAKGVLRKNASGGVMPKKQKGKIEKSVRSRRQKSKLFTSTMKQELLSHTSRRS